MWADFPHGTPCGRVSFCVSSLWKTSVAVSGSSRTGQASGQGWWQHWVTTAEPHSTWAEQSWTVKAAATSKVSPGNPDVNMGKGQLCHSWLWRLQLRWSPSLLCPSLCCQHSCLFSPHISRCSYKKPMNTLFFFQWTLNKIIWGGCCLW